MPGVRKNKPVTRSKGQQQEPRDSVYVKEMEVIDKAVELKNSRNDKYRQLCERMNSLMQKFPNEKQSMETLMKLMNGIIQDSGKIAAEDAKKAANDADNRRCLKSVMMYNVHKIKFPSNVPVYEVSTFEEKLTDEIHHITRGRVQASQITVLQRTENGKPMTVRVKLGSPQQRGMLYKMLGVSKKYAPESHEVFAGIAVRDCFPSEVLPEVKKLSEEGMKAKRNNECVAFRVSSQGDGCVPVLQVRRAYGDRWMVYARRERVAGPDPRSRGQDEKMEDGKEAAGDVGLKK
jgi:hypothetical protein